MLIKEPKYCYNDIAIVPAIKSSVEHRSECNPYTGKFEESTLPIFTAPMSTVVNEENFELFEENNIIPILPRNFPLETRIEYVKNGKWAAFGLDEFEDTFVINDWDMEMSPYVNVLVDIANGHMTKAHDLIYEAKTKYHWDYRFNIMAGNIANPKAYYELARAGADFVRLSVGTGEGCLSWTKLGIGYPIASLIDETYQIKKQLEHIGENTPFIIAQIMNSFPNKKPIMKNAKSTLNIFLVVVAFFFLEDLKIYFLTQPTIVVWNLSQNSETDSAKNGELKFSGSSISKTFETPSATSMPPEKAQ